MAPSEAAPAADEFERALETLAGAVRVIGRFALDTPELPARKVHELAEHWSQHLLIRRPKPGDEARTTNLPKRDYRALAEFITEQRKQESAHVAKALTDLRQTVWAFVRSLNSAFTSDAQGDSQVMEQLRDLREAAQHGSFEQLRRAAVSAADSITLVVERREREQLARTSHLGDKLLALGRGLDEPSREASVDPVTLLNVRAAFDEYAGQLVELRPFVDQPRALVLVELNEYARLQAQSGDAAVNAAFAALSACLVRTFLRKDDFLARFDEQRIAVVLPDTDFKHALVLAERLPAALRRTEIPGQPSLSLTVALGVSALAARDTLASWIERAETALEQARPKHVPNAAPV